jgi:hypothetical protein
VKAAEVFTDAKKFQCARVSGDTAPTSTDRPYLLSPLAEAPAPREAFVVPRGGSVPASGIGTTYVNQPSAARLLNRAFSSFLAR